MKKRIPEPPKMPETMYLLVWEDGGAKVKIEPVKVIRHAEGNAYIVQYNKKHLPAKVDVELFATPFEAFDAVIEHADEMVMVGFAMIKTLAEDIRYTLQHEGKDISSDMSAATAQMVQTAAYEQENIINAAKQFVALQRRRKE